MNICADCRRILDCPWEIAGKPVPGWTARPSRLPVGGGKTIPTYCVMDCPLFLPPGGYTGPDAEQKNNRRPIVATNTQTGEVRRYKSIREAIVDGFHRSSVNRVLTGEQTEYKGWTFRRDDEPLDH